jgi:hypothetical protein
MAGTPVTLIRAGYVAAILAVLVGVFPGVFAGWLDPVVGRASLAIGGLTILVLSVGALVVALRWSQAGGSRRVALPLIVLAAIGLWLAVAWTVVGVMRAVLVAGPPTPG